MTGLYLSYERLMFYTAGTYTDDPFEKEEIVQAALVRLLQKQETLQQLSEAARASYIVTAVRHTAVNHRVKSAREAARCVPLDDEPENQPELQMPAAELHVIELEDRAALLRAFDALSEQDRLLLTGRYTLELTDDALAQELGCQPDSVRMKLTRARRRLLQLIEKEAGAHDA